MSAGSGCWPAASVSVLFICVIMRLKRYAKWPKLIKVWLLCFIIASVAYRAYHKTGLFSC